MNSACPVNRRLVPWLAMLTNILVLAMLVTPAAAARLLTDRLPVMMACSAAIGVGSGVIGLFVSYHANVAAGGTIVLVATAVFGVVWLLAPAHGVLARRVPARFARGVAREPRGLRESPGIRTPKGR
jgi:manganese/iron transport system permease protein